MFSLKIDLNDFTNIPVNIDCKVAVAYTDSCSCWLHMTTSCYSALTIIIIFFVPCKVACFFLTNCQFFCIGSLSYLCFARQWGYVDSMYGFYIVLRRLRCITWCFPFTFMGITEPFLFPQGAVAVPFDLEDKELITKGYHSGYIHKRV